MSRLLKKNSYAEYCENNESIYKPASIVALYTHEGEIEETIEHPKFSQETVITNTGFCYS